MRWSSSNCLFVFLLTSVTFDGIVARPLPDPELVGLYRRTPPPRQGSSKPPPPPLPYTPVAKRTRSSSQQPRPPTQPQNQHPAPAHPGPVHPGPVHPGPVHPGPVHPAPVRPAPVRQRTPPPATGGTSSNPHNVRPPNPRGHNPNPAVQGRTGQSSSQIPQPVKASNLKTHDYRAQTINQGDVYSPGQNRIVNRPTTPNTLKGLHADHIIEAQAVKAAHPDLTRQQKDDVSRILNDPMRNLVLTKDKTNLKKGKQTGNVIRGAPTDVTPGTQRYMKTVASKAEGVAKDIDNVVGAGPSLQNLQKKIAKETGTK